MSGKKWTKNEIEFMIKHRLDYSLAEMSARVGHPRSSVLDKIHDLGFRWRRTKPSYPKSWTKTEELFLANNYGKISTREIAKKLDRTLYSVRNKIEILNLWLRTKEEISEAPEFHLTDNEAAYIAGIIDGEGSLTVSLTWYYQYPGIGISLSICNTNLPLIQWLSVKLNTNQKYLRRHRVKNSKVTYSISIGQRKHLQKVIKKIFPYLIVKKQLIKPFLKILELKRNGALKSELLQTVLKFKKLQDVRNGKIKTSTEKLRHFISNLPKDI